MSISKELLMTSWGVGLAVITALFSNNRLRVQPVAVAKPKAVQTFENVRNEEGQL